MLYNLEWLWKINYHALNFIMLLKVPLASTLRGGKIPFDPFDKSQPVMAWNRQAEPMLPFNSRIRPRRNRNSPVMRSMVRETQLSPSHLIYPIFITEDVVGKEEISSMPGIYRHSLPSMMNEIKECMKYGVKSFILFPKINNDLKSNYGEEAYNAEGLVPKALRMIKESCPGAIVATDVALDPYSSMGHDGVVQDGVIVNDLTVMQLQKQAVMHARAGVDVVAPSDMMDGRVAAIRDALDVEGFTNVSIVSYTAKYASSYYGPFRDALDSHPGFGDKKTYQQDPGNSREALREADLDIAEGADMLMVKPGMPYLDIIRKIRDFSHVPIAAYQVSGEYSMIKSAAMKGWLNEKQTVLESLLCFRRAGADVILTYYAKDAAKWLFEEAHGGAAPACND
mmetsp:Transcript_12843/g.20965  ORF Transcript_12843/g.20965 Transcript_12843/m.20965 type:complete len:396 (-) Transcript_12843:87-1274(-)